MRSALDYVPLDIIVIKVQFLQKKNLALLGVMVALLDLQIVIVMDCVPKGIIARLLVSVV